MEDIPGNVKKVPDIVENYLFFCQRAIEITGNLQNRENIKDHKNKRENRGKRLTA